MRGCAKVLQTVKQGFVVGWTDGDQKIQILGIARLGMETHCNAAHDQIPNPRGVECRQQFDPIL